MVNNHLNQHFAVRSDIIKKLTGKAFVATINNATPENIERIVDALRIGDAISFAHLTTIEIELQHSVGLINEAYADINARIAAEAQP